MLNTDRYTVVEVLQFREMLLANFGLHSNLVNHGGKPRVQFKQRHYALVQSLVRDHIHPDLLSLIRV